MIEINGMDSIVTRFARSNEPEALSQIAQITFSETYTEALNQEDILKYNEKFRKNQTAESWLNDSSTKVWVAENDGILIGYLTLTPPDLPTEIYPGDLEIKKIYLLKKFHGTGIGSKLLNNAIDYSKEIGCKRVLLGVYTQNDRAISFYKKSGFVQIGTRQFLVGNTSYDDIVLALKI